MEMSIELLVAKLHNYAGYSYNFGRILLIGAAATVIGGTAIGSFEVLFFSRVLGRLPFGLSLLVKGIFYLVCIFFFTTLATQVSYSFIINKPLFHEDVLNRLAVYIQSPKIWATTIYWGIMIIAAVFILQVSQKFGRGVLLNFILGKYHQPKEESRIFMFLDLTSSTAYAERLGHIKYSRLIQDCFYDLTAAAADCHANIYQYVGDEVVLTWQKETGLKNNRCINVFFEYQQAIKKREDHYKHEYGLVPEFKAGVHLGTVTVVEDDTLNGEFGLGGNASLATVDALNTTARIRSLCKTYKKNLIVSAELLSLLPELDNDFSVESIGVCQLKGKQNVIALFSVEKTTSS